MMLALVHDRARETRQERKIWAYARRAEVQYARSLRAVARHVGDIVRGMWTDGAEAALRQALQRYADLLDPWARSTAARMLADVSRRDEAAWARVSTTMSRALRDEIQTAPTGDLFREIMAQQVHLIRSLPLEAAQRVHELVIRGMEGSTRAGSVAEEILRSGEVTRARANLIARTETARAASGLLQARAQHVGSEGYIWRTAEDSDVRPLHKKLNGKFVRWDAPPVAGERGELAHAGQIYNCRCYPDPVIDDPEQAAA